jgi:hypothetical protein
MSGHPVNDDALNGNKAEITRDEDPIDAMLQQLLQQYPPPQSECITQHDVSPTQGH